MMWNVILFCSVALSGVKKSISSGSNTNGSLIDYESSKGEMLKISTFINNVLKDYDIKLRPNAGGKPVEVEVEFKVVSLGKIDEANMEYTMDIFFRQWWHDPRFKHNYTKAFTMAEDARKLFWIPDTYFINAMKSSFHRVTKDNSRIIIYPNGDVYYSTRLTVTLQCYMNLFLYPMDTQKCPFLLESYAYTKDDVFYRWTKRGTKGIEIMSKETAQFVLLLSRTERIDEDKISGNFSQLLATFTFKRRLEYFIITIVTPAVILVILSWCSFWIVPDAIPARISLSITTILSTLLLSGTVNAQMPKVSYLKAIDVFLLGNFTFIFLALIEYVAVLNTNPRCPFKVGFLKKICNTGESNEEKDVKRNSRCEHKPSDPMLMYDMNGFSWDAANNGYPRYHYIDKLCRIVFPLAYVIFINAYWFYYRNLATVRQESGYSV
ncbi:gamma-aminobutyric acid receptor subunit beta-4-like [Actinia tenebrosa]|uniref:Gamma-aminobutyric acid receptor subunit beta n=1 Tax=Actinia tenebrosa TaxID=6105 RepID=A0A6P8J6E2_ACTTE|nr:gamma-aminobutyric acid receptor subunit beta-4-like [Actinia tenebrosa]